MSELNKRTNEELKIYINTYGVQDAIAKIKSEDITDEKVSKLWTEMLKVKNDETKVVEAFKPIHKLVGSFHKDSNV